MGDIRAIYLDEQENKNKPSNDDIRYKYANEVPNAKESYWTSRTMAPFRVAKDLGDLIFEKLRSLPSYQEKAKTEVPGLLEGLNERPKRTIGQDIAGLAEAGQNIFNSPHDAINYATTRLHLVPENINQKVQMARMPEDTERMINEVFGKPEYPGEALARGLGRNSQAITGVVGLSKDILPYLNPANIPRALKNTSGLEKELETATKEHAGALEEEQIEKNASKRAFNTRDLDSLIYKRDMAKDNLNNTYKQLNANPPQSLAEHLEANNALQKYHQEFNEANTALEKAKSSAVQEPKVKTANPDIIQAKINEKQDKLNQLNDDIKNGKPVSDEELTNSKNELNTAKSEYEENKNLAESTAGAGTSKENALQLKINNNSRKITDLQDKLTQHQEMGNEPTTQFEEKEIPDISQFEENEKRASAYHENAQKMVDKAQNDIEHHVNIGADNSLRASRELKHEIESTNKYWSDAYKNLTDKLKKIKFQLSNRMPDIKDFFIESENPELINLLHKSPTIEDVSASSFMDKQKNFRDARYDLKQRMSVEPNAEKRTQLKDAYEKSAQVEKIINQTLEEGLGEHLPEYRRVNEGYSKQVFPLRNNAIAEKVKEGGKLSSDIAHELSGDQEGQDVLRELALRNDEVKRNIMGQQYLKGGKDKTSFYNPDETVREYSNTMPELNKLIGKRENAISYANDAKTNLDKSKELHNEAKANNEKITKENEGISKEREKYNAAQEEEKERVANEKIQHQKDIKELQEKNTLLGGIKSKLAEKSAKLENLETYHKKLSDLKKYHENTTQSIKDVSSDLKILNEHLSSIKNAQERVKTLNKPEVIKPTKAPDINKIKDKITGLTDNIKKLDETISKLDKASKNTDLKLSKKLEIQRTLDEANDIKKEAKRRLKVAGIAITAATGLHIGLNLKDYLINKKTG